MRINDGKNNFYRTLNLDDDTKKFLKLFRQVKKSILDEPEGNSSGKIIKIEENA